MKTSIPFTVIQTPYGKVGEQPFRYCALNSPTNIVFQGIPTQADFENVVEKYKVDRVIIDLEICKFIMDKWNEKFWLVHEYSFIEGITNYLARDEHGNLCKDGLSYDEMTELIRFYMNKNIAHLEQVLAFAKRQLTH